MTDIIEFLRSIDWTSPQAVAVVVLLTVFAILRRWFLLAMTLLVLTLGRGLCQLQLNRELISDSSLTLASIVYLVGGVIIATVAAAEFFAKD